MSTDADAVVVGGGHNGLVCAAYLARAGLNVVVLERRSTVGGCASTVDACGARVNICNCDHSLILSTPIVEELDLARHGLRYLAVDPMQLSMTWPGEDAWFLFRDPRRTLASLALAHPAEVAAYRHYLEVALPAARLMLSLAQELPTPCRVGAVLARERGRGAATLLRWSRASIAEVVRRLFATEALRGPLVTTGPAVWGAPPDQPGTGLGALGYAVKHLTGVSRPAGGSGSLTDALAAAVAGQGGRIRTRAAVSAILAEAGRVRGVRLASGEEVLADMVVAAVDPRLAIVEWLGSGAPATAPSFVERWRHRPAGEGYESKIDAVIRERPRYRGLSERHLAAVGVDEPLVPTTVVSPSVREIAAAHAAMSRGTVAARPMLFANVPSVADSSMRPGPGRDVLSLEVLFTPYSLRGGWARSDEPRRWLSAYATLLETDLTSAIEDWRVMTPPAYEVEFSLRRGVVPSFHGSVLSAIAGRRDRELTRYETPVPGLFLTGGGTFPGAGVWGCAGRNAAAVALRRWRRGRWAPAGAGRPRR